MQTNGRGHVANSTRGAASNRGRETVRGAASDIRVQRTNAD